MQALVDIFNRAISACGTDIGITTPDENSREAALCRLWFPLVRDNVLASAPWPSVRRYARLARIAERDPNNPWEPGNPAPRYRFAYARPADLLHPYRTQSYRPFEYGLVGNQRAISSDEEMPILYYNARIEDPAFWEPNLSTAITYTLATHIAIPLTGRASHLQQNAELAFLLVEEAQVQAANSDDQNEEVLPEWLQTRGYANPQMSRFVYPMQSLNVGASK